MSKKDAKVSEAQLPMPPCVEQFVSVLQEWVQQKQGANQPPGSSIFGDASDHEEQIGKPKNTKRTEAVAVNVAMEFQNVSVANKEVYKGLDEWLVGFLKFTVGVRAMNSEEIKRKISLENRKKLCGEDYKVRSFPLVQSKPTSMRLPESTTHDGKKTDLSPHQRCGSRNSIPTLPKRTNWHVAITDNLR